MENMKATKPSILEVEHNSKLFDLTFFLRSIDPTATSIMHGIILLIETQSSLKVCCPEEHVCGPGPSWRH